MMRSSDDGNLRCRVSAPTPPSGIIPEMQAHGNAWRAEVTVGGGEGWEGGGEGVDVTC
jgi:hypothetical protein